MTDSAKEKWYELTQGKHHHREVGEDGKEEKMVLREGDRVMLTDEQYENLKDRFKPVKGKKKEEDEDPNPPLTPTQPQQNAETSSENADKVPKGTDTTSDDKKANEDKVSKPGEGKTGAGSTAQTPPGQTKTVP